MQLIIDNRSGVHNHDIYVAASSEEIAAGWLLKLDGEQHTLLCLEREDGWHFMAGGGPSFYIITVGNDDQNLVFQNSDGDKSITMELCAGGQSADFPEIFCADRNKTLHLISLFFNGNEKQERWVIS